MQFVTLMKTIQWVTQTQQEMKLSEMTAKPGFP